MEIHRLKSVLLEVRQLVGAGEAMDWNWQNWARQLSRHLRSRYVVLLEEEVARLRLENRGLVNSLLGTAGFPPISVEEDAKRGAVGLAAVRRRTWSQIARERELAAGKVASGRAIDGRVASGRATDGQVANR